MNLPGRITTDMYDIGFNLKSLACCKIFKDCHMQSILSFSVLEHPCSLLECFYVPVCQCTLQRMKNAT